jgi:hypothetical protein
LATPNSSSSLITGFHAAVDFAEVLHRLGNVTGPGLALGADHGRAFGDTPQRLAEIPAPADKRHLEAPFVDVVEIIGRSQYFGFIDKVYLQSFQNARFHKMPDSALSHHGNSDYPFDTFDHVQIGHARHAAFSPDIRGHAFESHNSGRAALLGDFGLLRRGDIHDDPALQHLGQPDFDFVVFGVESIQHYRLRTFFVSD